MKKIRKKIIAGRLANGVKIIFMIMCSTAISGCSKLAAGLYQIPYRGTLFVQNGWLPIKIYHVLVQQIAGNVDSVALLNNSSLSAVGSVEPRSMRLMAKYPGDDYSYVSDVEAFITADGGKMRDYIFFRDAVPLETGEKIDLAPNSVDLKPYLVRKDWKVEVWFTLRDLPPHTVETQVDFSFLAKK